jgi:hypothetical protein
MGFCVNGQQLDCVFNNEKKKTSKGRESGLQVYYFKKFSSAYKKFSDEVQKIEM